MPLYEYECEACGKRFEVIQRFSDPHADTCRVCGKGPVRRLFSSPAIQFKGTGWYITDYSQKGKSSGESGSESSTPAKTDTKETSSSASSSGDGNKTAATPASTPAKSDPAS
jgi:putative FmdB family regulatory protein